MSRSNTDINATTSIKSNQIKSNPIIDIPIVLIEPTTTFHEHNLSTHQMYYPNCYMGCMRSRNNIKHTNAAILTTK